MINAPKLQRTSDMIAVGQPPQLAGTELSDEDLDKVAGGSVDVRVTPLLQTTHFTTTTRGNVETFVNCELENVGLGHFLVTSGGDLPVETMSLNFTKITATFSR
jgi:hypothetical protein